MGSPDPHGERVLITGASRGLGLEFVRRFAARGARVFATCRDPGQAAALQEVADERDNVVVLPLDVTDEASIRAAVAAVQADGDGTLDVLVNNAGLSPRGEEFANLDAAAMQGVFAVNAIAPMIVAQHFRPLLVGGDRPRIVNISSSMGSLEKKEYGRHYSYASSKAALNMLTRAAGHDLADEGIIVVALHPGWVQTDLGGTQATLSPRESVEGMIAVIDGLAPADSTRFLTWKGDRHPW